MMPSLMKTMLLALGLFLSSFEIRRFLKAFLRPQHLTMANKRNTDPLDSYYLPDANTARRRVSAGTLVRQQQQSSHSNTISVAAATALSLFGIERVDRSKRLEFVHITKTGGSAIEMGGAATNVQWGACHYLELPHLGCTQPGDWEWPETLEMPDHMKNKAYYEPWHSPPHWLVPNPHPKDSVANFVVVRDPYQRILSEFYCSAFGYNGTVTAQSLNAWVTKKLTEVTPYFGHMLPQHYYVFHHSSGARLVDHVLRYEALTDEFNLLMRLYQLEIHLPKKDTAHFVISLDETNPRLTEKDFTTRTIRLINEHFWLDFDLFGYDML